MSRTGHIPTDAARTRSRRTAGPQARRAASSRCAMQQLLAPREYAAASWSRRAARLKVLDEAGLDQHAVEAARLRAVAAGIEQAVAAEHDLLLLHECRIKRNARRVLNDDRQ